MARALQAGGVRPGDRVAFIGASGPGFVEVLYGAAKCRVIFTAVSNRLAAREVLDILADAEPRVLIVDRAAAPLVTDVGSLGFDCRVLVTDGTYQAWRDAARATDPGEEASPDETALILYTSGTTGAPKGVELTGRNLGCALHELHAGIGLDENSVCAAPIPFFHIAGLGLLLAANLNGGNLLLEQAADTLAVLRLLADRRVTHAAAVPTVLQRLLALPECKTADWSALSYVVYGASPIPLPVLRDATEIIGCSFLQSYGLTAGSRIMKGYWRKPEQTAEVMLPGGWLRTGDGGSLDADGFLYLHDRLKDMIVSGGENVYPAEVESIMTGHPAVAEVAVVGVPSAEWGESPYAVVVLHPGAELSETQLIAWTRDRLAHFKCPVGVSFAASLARTASGKLQKQAIRATLTTPAIP